MLQRDKKGRDTVRDGCKGAKVIAVIQTTATIGEGTEKDPCRYKYQYWDLSGKLLAEHDTIVEAEDCDFRADVT